MLDIFLISLLAGMLSWVIFTLKTSKSKKGNPLVKELSREATEQAIHLEDLSVLWVTTNNWNEQECNIDEKVTRNFFEYEAVTSHAEIEKENLESEPINDNEEHSEQKGLERQAYLFSILEKIGESLNIPNDKGVYEIFSLDGAIYVHTSGLTKIIKELTGETNKEVLKEKVKEVSLSFINGGISDSGFSKFIWTLSDGKKGKSLYMAIPSEYLPEGTQVADSSNIVSMEKNDE